MNDDGAPTRELNTGAVLRRLQGKRRITPAQVAALRESELGTGLRSVAEAEALFAIERSGIETCRAWGDFFVEILLDFLVWDERPIGGLDEQRAIWLAGQVGERPTPACLALLVAVLDEARDVPGWFPEAVQLRARAVFAVKPATSNPLAA